MLTAEDAGASRWLTATAVPAEVPIPVGLAVLAAQAGRGWRCRAIGAGGTGWAGSPDSGPESVTVAAGAAWWDGVVGEAIATWRCRSDRWGPRRATATPLEATTSRADATASPT